MVFNPSRRVLQIYCLILHLLVESAFLYSEADGNDIGYFVQYNLDVLLKSFDALSRYIKRKNNEKKKSEKLLHLGNITARQAEILSLCIENSDK